MSLIQEQMFLCTVSIDGEPLGVFDSFDGGDIETDGESYNAGGMAEPEALPDTPRTTQVTVGRGFRGERDGPLKKWINARVNHEIIIGKQPLNPDKTPVPDALETFRGIVAGVATPKHNSNGKDVTTLEITATINGLPA